MITSPSPSESAYAKGLFHRGIVQSGATETMGVTFASAEASAALTEHILRELNVSPDELEKLQTLDWNELERASQEALSETAEQFQIPAPLTDGYAMEWGPVVDGDYLPTNPVTEDSFAAAGADISLLIGSNLNEWTRFMGGPHENMPEEAVEAFTQTYPGLSSDQAPYVDTLIRMPTLKIMSHKADQGGAAVYAYVFTIDNACHGAEIPYVFANSDRPLGHQVSQAWVNFAKTGVPLADGLPTWEPYTREGGATMLLSDDSALVYHHDAALLEPDYIY